MLKRAISVNELLNKNFAEYPFDGDWEASFGIPEASGVWLIWGNSGNGKTGFALKLATYLNSFARVAYNTLEEGPRKSLQVALRRIDADAAQGIQILNEDMDHLRMRLEKHKSPQVVIIDSFQYTGLTKSEYKALKRDFPTKLFIFISHAEGSQPEGRAAKFVKYDADVKIHIEGHKAFVVSRYGGGEPYTIWKEGAEEYWQNIKQ